MLRTLQITTFLAISLCFGLTGVVWGQPAASCDALTDEVYQGFQSGDHDSEEALRRIAVLAGEAESCYDQGRIPRRIWLREMHIWALDQLAQHIDFVENTWLANRLAESFWGDFGADAKPASKANVARFLIRFRSFRGDLEGAVMALDSAKHYLGALAFDRQLHVLLSEASLYLDDGQHRRAEAIAGRVYVQATGHGLATGEADLAFIRARALHLRGEARIEQARGSPPPRVLASAIEDLRAAAGAFGELDMLDRQSAATASLAEAYTLAGRDVLAENRLEEALTLTRNEASPKPEIFVLLVRGRIRVEQGRLAEAERDLERGLALSDSAGIGKHTFDLLFERARLDEMRRSLAGARDRYVRLARLSVPFADGGVRAAVLRREAAYRAAGLELTLMRRERRLLLSGLAMLMLLALSAVAVAVVRWRRVAATTWRHELEGRHSESAMLGYMYETIHRPRQVASQIRGLDAGLARRLERGRLRGRTECYRCVAHLVYVVERRAISHDAVRMNLQRLFKKHDDWDWPTSTQSWKAHFRAHPIDYLS